MKLYEYQAKDIFKRFGIKVPKGRIIQNGKEVRDISLNPEDTVLKSQVTVGGRGKAGGILFPESPEENLQMIEKLLGMDIKGEAVEKILIEEKTDISKEFYLGVTIDYSSRAPVVMACSEGGVDIEEIASENPEKFIKSTVDLEEGIPEDFLKRVDELLTRGASDILRKIWKVFREYDAEQVEINPLALSGENDLIALDAVLNVNDDSLFRLPELAELKKEKSTADPLEERAREEGWTYIELDGNVGILSSGAGLTMAILDLMNMEGVKPANFLDTAQMDAEGIYRAFDLLLENEDVEMVFVNIFAGLNRCDELAGGLKKFIEDHDLDIPVVVRMIGNQEQRGNEILKEIGIEPIPGLEEAIEKVRKVSGDI